MKMKILLTGANGYIGMRLLPVLVRNGHDVVCLVRDKRRMKVDKSLKENISYYEADLLKENSLDELPQDLDAAYYLVHSIGASADYEKLEAQAARNFVDSIQKTNCRQIIYLSGIVNDQNLSKHLRSRKNVEDILMQNHIPTTVLRAGIIIGSGGASFEIIRDLVEKLPVMIAPKWVNTKSQPIALRNVLQYLNGVLLRNQAYQKVFDIGGPEVLSYKELLLQFADVRKLKRYIISAPILSPRLSSLWLYFVTSTSFRLARGLVDSMKNQVTVQHKGIEEIVQADLLSYREAVERHLTALPRMKSSPVGKIRSTAPSLISIYLTTSKCRSMAYTKVFVRFLLTKPKDKSSITSGALGVKGAGTIWVFFGKCEVFWIKS